MQRNKALTCLASLLTLALGSGSAQALTATPSFTISAANFTMPSSGGGNIPITLTSVNGYVGTVVVICTPPSEPAGVILPYCDLPGPVASTYVLTANATMKEGIGISSIPPLPPSAAMLNLAGHGSETGWVLAGVFMLGVGLRRRKARWPMRLLLTAGMLIGLTGIGACGGSTSLISHATLTPGTYTYTLNAHDQVNPSLSATATATVTIPAGIQKIVVQ